MKGRSAQTLSEQKLFPTRPQSPKNRNEEKSFTSPHATKRSAEKSFHMCPRETARISAKEKLQFFNKKIDFWFKNQTNIKDAFEMIERELSGYLSNPKSTFHSLTDRARQINFPSGFVFRQKHGLSPGRDLLLVFNKISSQPHGNFLHLENPELGIVGILENYDLTRDLFLMRGDLLDELYNFELYDKKIILICKLLEKKKQKYGETYLQYLQNVFSYSQITFINELQSIMSQPSDESISLSQKLLNKRNAESNAHTRNQLQSLLLSKSSEHKLPSQDFATQIKSISNAEVRYVLQSILNHPSEDPLLLFNKLLQQLETLKEEQYKIKDKLKAELDPPEAKLKAELDKVEAKLNTEERNKRQELYENLDTIKNIINFAGEYGITKEELDQAYKDKPSWSENVLANEKALSNLEEKRLREEQLKKQQLKEEQLKQQQLEEEQLKQQQLEEEQLKKQQPEEEQLKKQQPEEKQLKQQAKYPLKISEISLARWGIGSYFLPPNRYYGSPKSVAEPSTEANSPAKNSDISPRKSPS